MTDQLPDDTPSRLPPEHPTDPPDEDEIKAQAKPVPEADPACRSVKISLPRSVRHLLS